MKTEGYETKSGKKKWIKCGGWSHSCKHGYHVSCGYLYREWTGYGVHSCVKIELCYRMWGGHLTAGENIYIYIYIHTHVYRLMSQFHGEYIYMYIYIHVYHLMSQFHFISKICKCAMYLAVLNEVKACGTIAL